MVLLDDSGREPKAHAGTAFFLGGEEGFKNACAYRSRNPSTLIKDAHANRRYGSLLLTLERCSMNPHMQGAPDRSGFHGVSDNV